MRLWKPLKRGFCPTWQIGNVSFKSLHTILTEIEAVLNCKPLMYVGADDENALTPHLICGKSIISLPVENVVKSLEDSYQHVQKCFKDARERWYREYLTEMRVHNKKIKKYETPKVGSLVLVKSNIRFVYGSQTVGRAGLSEFCNILNIPQPVWPTPYNNIQEKLSEVSVEHANQSMKEAGQRLFSYMLEKEPDNARINEDGSNSCFSRLARS
eukprot:TCONS_00071909-protein